ncbi:unnamed protein product, partial [Prorocentrum cordatum]
RRPTPPSRPGPCGWARGARRPTPTCALRWACPPQAAETSGVATQGPAATLATPASWRGPGRRRRAAFSRRRARRCCPGRASRACRPRPGARSCRPGSSAARAGCLRAGSAGPTTSCRRGPGACCKPRAQGLRGRVSAPSVAVLGGDGVLRAPALPSSASAPAVGSSAPPPQRRSLPHAAAAPSPASPAAHRHTALAARLPDRVAAAAREQGPLAQGKLVTLLSGVPAAAPAAGPPPGPREVAAESKLVGRPREISKTLAPRGRQLDGEGLRALALALAGHFGSLEAAWRQFDLNQTGLVSRYQWDAALDRLPFGMQDVCGMPGGRVFLQLSQAGEVTAEGWRRFFSDFAESAEGSQALAQAAERVAARRRTTPAGQASAAAAEARGAAAPARPERRSLPDRSPWSAADVLEREALLSREELAEVELQAKAEKDVLQDELKELNLSGLQALVYIITAKLGTLDRAAGWFDLSKTGKVSHNEFDVGNRVMRIDPKELTGFNTSEIYRMMDTTSTGMVPAREFQAFLDKILEEMKESGLGDALAKAAGLAQRAKSRRRLSEKLPPPREPPRRTSTAAPEPQTPAVVEEVKNIGGHEFHGCE